MSLAPNKAVCWFPSSELKGMSMTKWKTTKIGIIGKSNQEFSLSKGGWKETRNTCDCDDANSRNHEEVVGSRTNNCTRPQITGIKAFAKQFDNWSKNMIWYVVSCSRLNLSRKSASYKEIMRCILVIHIKK